MKPKFPILQYHSIDLNIYICPASMMELQFVQTKGYTTTYGLDKCFLQRPISAASCQLNMAML